MRDALNAESDKQQIGDLFSRQYIERGAPLQDNKFFRNRLDAYLQANHSADYAALAAYLRQETGLVVDTFYSDTYKTLYYKFGDFFSKTKIEHVLSAVTLIWRYLQTKYPEIRYAKTTHPERGVVIDKAAPRVTTYPKAEAWRGFVLRALREENMGYSIDEKGGIHYFIDEEFERNKAAALSCLGVARYEAVRVAFEQAHGYLDAQPPDTKASVRAAFESLEILARLIDPESKNLNRWMVENKLKPIALGSAKDATEKAVIQRLLDGLAQAVDGLHNYRHGQGSEEPVAPSLAVSVYVVSTVAAALRWFVTLDQGLQ